jgi:hypothetical protein
MGCCQPPLTFNQRYKIHEGRWLIHHAATWNIAVTWHFPKSMRSYYNRYDKDWHAKELRRYFNRLDRKIYKAGLKNRNERLPRIISLEHEDGVGWHAHGLLTNPPHLTEEHTSQLIEQEWRKHTARFPAHKFDQRLIDIGPVRADYLGYLTKRTAHHSDDARGIIDELNTYLPQAYHH